MSSSERTGFTSFAACLVVLPLAFASGCAAPGDGRPWSYASEGIVAGFACGPLFVVCSPVAGLIGAAFDSERKATLSPGPPSYSGPLGDHFDWLGRVDDNDDLPTGTMYLVTNSVREVPGSSPTLKLKSALVVVEYDVKTRYGELSYVGTTSSDCANGTISIHSWETYPRRGGKGSKVRSWALPPMTVEKPLGTLGAAFRAVCAKG